MSRSESSCGFSLIEVVVTVAILGLIATTVLGGLLSTMTESRRGFNRAQAVAWVQSELDFLRMQGYGIANTVTPRHIPDTSDPANDATTGYLPDYGSLQEPRIPPGFYQAEIEVADVGTLPLKRLTVRLYRTAGSPPYTILVTYVARFTYP